MKKRFSGLMDSPIARGHFLRLALVLIMINLISSALFFAYTIQAMEDEFIAANNQRGQQALGRLHRVLDETWRMCSVLVTDESVQAYFSPGGAEMLVDECAGRIQTKIQAYTLPIQYLHSIYVYAPEAGRIVLPREQLLIGQLPDRDWLDAVENMQSATSLLCRKIEGKYPYSLSLLFRNDRYGYAACAIANLDLRQLGRGILEQGDENNRIFLVNKQGEILYRAGMEELMESVDTVPELQYLELNGKDASCLHQQQSIYAFSQIYDEENGWYLVSISSLNEYAQRIRQIYLMVFLFLLGGAVLSVVISLFFGMRAYRPIAAIRHSLENPQAMMLPTGKNTQEIQKIAEAIIVQYRTNENLRKALDERIEIMNKTEIRALEAQINPHFLFNTLSLIRIHISRKLGEEDVATRLVIWMSKLLNYSLESDEMVPLKREAEQAGQYANILLERYDHAFDIAFDISPDCLMLPVPKLVFQPFIENAVKYGLSMLEERRGLLNIQVNRKNQMLRISIADNGLGMANERLEEIEEILRSGELPSRRIGISNVVRRLRLIFGEQVGFSLTSAPGEGTKIEILLPLMLDLEEE